MRPLLRIAFRPLALVLYGVLALAVLAWWAGPLVAVGGRRPLEGAWARAGVVAALLLAWLAAVLVAAWRRRRAEPSGEPREADPAAREAEQLGQRFDEALAMLEDGARAAGRRGAHLYDLPWYLLLGAPGSGKTTALLNAGLTFPLATRMGQVPARRAAATRHCDWWLTDQAAFIDTAGRYAMQPAGAPADAAGWACLLGLLRRSRPRRPVNGVLLAIGVRDLLQRTPAERKEHAACLRERLQELHERLGVRPPVYVLVTQADLIAGFNETFGELGPEERDQVWGFSFPHDPREPDGGEAPVAAFGGEFAALEKRLRERLPDRMEAESDPLRRAAAFAFPQQFAGLGGLLGGFLEALFGGGDGLEERALLRGVYFTSGTQEGAPVDRVLGTLSRTFGIDGPPASIAAARGRGFFLPRLLREVVLAEQGLVGENRHAEAARRRRRRAVLGAIALAALALAGGLTVSGLRNQAYVAAVAARLPETRQAVDALPPAGNGAAEDDLDTLARVLDRVAATPRPPGHAIDGPPLLSGLGLYQGEHLQAGAGIGYRRLLERALLPRVARRLEERLRAVDRKDLERSYEALRACLMLHTPTHFDARALLAWIVADWDAHPAGAPSPERRAAMAVHLGAALAPGAPAGLAPPDAALVAEVRERLAAYPLEYRVLSRLRRERIGADLPDFSVAAAGGPDAAQVFARASGQPITRGIPGLFTRDGYFKAFRPAIPAAARQLEAEQAWVLGTPVPPAAGDGELGERVRRLYLQEYVAAWDAYLADVRLARLDGLERSLTVARVLAAPGSPLPAYLRAAARETQLAAQARTEAATGVAGRDGKNGKGGDGGDGGNGDQRGQADAAGGQAAAPVPEARVDEHFADLHRLVAGNPAPIDEAGRLFNDVFVQLGAIDAARRSHGTPPPAIAGAAAASLQPEPVRSMLETLADAGAHQRRSVERQGLSAELRPIAESCRRAIAGRYPFAPGAASDVLPDDFGQLFGFGGLLDDFTQRRLAPLIDASATPWTYRPLPDGGRPAGGAGLAEFQRAARIREAFFRDGGKAPGFRVDLRVAGMSEGLKEVVLEIDGQPLRFPAGDTAARTVAWPGARAAARIRLSAGEGAPPRTFDGPWALFRLLDAFEVRPSPQPERVTVALDLDGRQALLEVTTHSALNPLRLRELRAFHCPDGL